MLAESLQGAAARVLVFEDSAGRSGMPTKKLVASRLIGAFYWQSGGLFLLPGRQDFNQYVQNEKRKNH